MLRSGTICSESCSRTCRTNVSLWRPSNTHCDGGGGGAGLTHCTDAMQTHCTKTEEHFALSAPPFCLLSIFILVYIKSIYIYPRRLMRLEGKKLLFSVEWVRRCDCFLEGEMFGVLVAGCLILDSDTSRLLYKCDFECNGFTQWDHFMQREHLWMVSLSFRTGAGTISL